MIRPSPEMPVVVILILLLFAIPLCSTEDIELEEHMWPLAHCTVPLGTITLVRVNGTVTYLWIDNVRMMLSINMSALFEHAHNLWSKDKEKALLPMHESIHIVTPDEVKMRSEMEGFMMIIHGDWTHSKNRMKDAFVLGVQCETVNRANMEKFGTNSFSHAT